MVMMSPGFAPRDPYFVPEHVVEAIRRNPPPGFWGATKGKALQIQVCGLCGLPNLISMSDLDDKESPNTVSSIYWMRDPNLCYFCAPVFSRYPEVAIWVANVVAWREFVGSPPSTG